MGEKKVAIYCRVAGNGNAELKQIALEHQRQNLEHYAAKKGLTVVNCYEDVGYNGLNDDRPVALIPCWCIRRTGCIGSRRIITICRSA